MSCPNENLHGYGRATQAPQPNVSVCGIVTTQANTAEYSSYTEHSQIVALGLNVSTVSLNSGCQDSGSR